MDTTHVILILSLASFWTAQGLEMNIPGPANGEHLLREKGELKLICHLDMGLQVILDYKVQWFHTPSFVEGEAPAEPKVLADHQELKEGASVDHYGVDVKYEADNTNVTLSLKNAQSGMDGMYTCQALPTKTGTMVEKQVHVTVPSNVGAIQLKFDNEKVTSESGVPVQREEGEFDVSCKAVGFHPAASLQLFLGDAPVEAGNPEVSLDEDASKSAKAKRQEASLSVTKMKFMAAHTDKTLKCVARADFPNAMSKTASLPLKIIALEPVVTCSQNTTALAGHRYVTLSCHVDHARVEVDTYRFEIGDTGEMIHPNEKKPPNFHTVLVEQLSDTKDKVSLVLYEAEDFHFETFYYLDVFLTNGQKFREKAKLVRADSTGGASKPVAYALCLLLFALVWSL